MKFLSRTRAARPYMKLLAMAAVLAVFVVAGVVRHAYAATPAVAVQQVPEQLSQAISSLYQLLTLALMTMGVGGGAQGVLGDLPDATAGPWTIKGGVILLSVLGVVAVVVSDFLGWLPAPAAFATPQAWFAAQWAAVVAVTALLYSLGGFGVDHVAKAEAAAAGQDPKRL